MDTTPLSPADIAQLQAWNQTATDYPQDQTITSLFEQQAEKTPDNIAVLFEHDQLTYRELNQRANQLAHHLIEQGVKANTLVGICVERSLEMIIGLFGILKAGGAYVPLDPGYPAERLKFMLEDSQIACLLTQSPVQANLPGLFDDFKLILLDQPEQFTAQPSTNPIPRSQPDDLAYVIYTSGSTGKPKGAMNAHQGICNRLLWMQAEYRLTENDRVLQKTPFSFDVSVWEFFWPLITGAPLVLAKPGGHKDPDYLARIIDEHAISTMHFVPSMLRAFLESGTLPTRRTLQRIICSGEALPTDLQQHCLERLPYATLHNLYGPTEAAVDVTYWHCQADSTHHRVPIGRPVANTRIHILDGQQQLQPPGSPGELCIGGVQVGKGYLNRPELTAEKFIEIELFGKTERIYKTGDLARWLPDGNLEYLGRIDHQIKLRGFRIELGEIEAVLSQHPAISSAVVVLHEREGNKSLAAYVVSATPPSFPRKRESIVEGGENRIDSRLRGNNGAFIYDLRTWLNDQLPNYMIPASFTMLDQLPLTPNGKLDRKALEERAATESFQAQKTNYVAPRTAEEEQLAAIWSSVLGIEQIGIHDNFFELGGHSLLATQLITRMREIFNLNLPLQQLMDTPSVAELNAHIKQMGGIGPGQSAAVPVITIDQAARHEPFPLNDIQQAYWVGREASMTLGNAAPHLYIELDCEQFDVVRLEQAWQCLIERHEMLRATVLPGGQQQILSQAPDYTFGKLDLSACSMEQKQRQLAAIRQTLSDHVFDAAQWPMFDIRVTRLDADTQRLHFSLDILLADGWSIFVLTHEWWRLYQNPGLALEPLSLSFRDYVLAEQAFHQQANGAAYQAALDYWRQRIATLPPAPRLPLARLPESIDKPRFRSRSFKLDANQWQQLKQKAAHARITPSALLLTVYADILALWSKSAHFTLNLTLFNRLPVHEQINQVVGDFTSLVLLEIDHRQARIFAERSKQTQQQLWADLNYREVTAVQVMREMAAQNKGQNRMMPVVFTSMLVLDTEQSEGVLTELGEQVFTLGATPQVWLDNVIMERPNEVEFFWFSVDELFPDGLLDDMFAAYRQHIEQLLEDDAAWSTSGTQYLLPAAHLALQQQVNATQRPPSNRFIHSLFDKQVAQQADRPAVLAGEVELSYRQLHAKVLQLAHWLRQQGVRRNHLVGVVMDKGWEQVVAVLGIAYAGGAYVPIDAEQPASRQHLLLQETNAKAVLTQAKWHQSLSFPEQVPVLAVDQHDLPPCDHLPELPDRELTDPAYIIYTSGSTGKPKGVVIDHRGAVNTLADINRRFQINANDRVLALSALNFDLSVYDIFGVLGAGGALVVPDPVHRRDPQHWASLMEQHQVTLWNTVPALMQMLVDYRNGSPLATPLRLVMMSGDWIPLTLPEKIKQLWPDCMTYSLGGATEASIWSIYYPIETVDHSKNSIPYGKPMDNQSFWVLDDHLQPRPIWATGDLYIGGIGLAKGYWKDKEKTDASFITQPETGERLYKTGDLGCWLPDGNIEFMGREDAQVKIRGHRIELGEIETHLNRHPDLKEGIVLALGDTLQEKQLVAYLVPEKDAVDETDYGAEGMKGALTDPLERAAFKLGQPGLRQFTHPAQTVALPEARLDEKAYLARQSYRQFQPEPVALHALSALLACLKPLQWPQAILPKYRYGSAGSLYPIQTYLYVKPNRVTGLDTGLYYYHPIRHQLIPVTHKVDDFNANLHGGINQDIFAESAFSLFLVSRMNAIEPMYGQMSRDFCLLEAGSMSQLLMDEAPRHDMGLCPIGGMQFEPIRASFQFDEGHEMLHSLMGGAISLEQKNSLPIPNKQNNTDEEAGLEKQVKAFLQQHLPGYMVPNHYVELDQLPLSANGKIDRKALPTPDLSQTTQSREPPANETERRLLEIVTRILQLDALGVTDPFFDVGANSLDFIELYNAIKQHWGIEVRVLDLFQLASVRKISERLNKLNAQTATDIEEGEL